ncbi:MAG: TetR/AcrR family transcriptional regulator [Thermoguttaceae bacterium]
MAEEKLDTKIRREQLAEAAMSLVASQGLRGLSLAAVAQRVGLVPSAIYRHFKNKEELLRAVIDRVEQRLLANVALARKETEDPLEQLQGILMRHIRFIREGRAVPRIIFAEDAHAGNLERRQRVLKVVGLYMGAVGDIIRQAQSEGRIRSECDPPTLAMLLLGIIVPAGILWHLTDGRFDVTRHAQRAWQLFLAACAVEKPTRSHANAHSRRRRRKP